MYMYFEKKTIIQLELNCFCVETNLLNSNYSIGKNKYTYLEVCIDKSDSQICPTRFHWDRK